MGVPGRRCSAHAWPDAAHPPPPCCHPAPHPHPTHHADPRRLALQVAAAELRPRQPAHGCAVPGGCGGGSEGSGRRRAVHLKTCCLAGWQPGTHIPCPATPPACVPVCLPAALQAADLRDALGALGGQEGAWLVQVRQGEAPLVGPHAPPATRPGGLRLLLPSSPTSAAPSACRGAPIGGHWGLNGSHTPHKDFNVSRWRLAQLSWDHPDVLNVSCWRERGSQAGAAGARGRFRHGRGASAEPSTAPRAPPSPCCPPLPPCCAGHHRVLGGKVRGTEARPRRAHPALRVAQIQVPDQSGGQRRVAPVSECASSV